MYLPEHAACGFMYRLSTDFALYQKYFTIFTCTMPKCSFLFMRRSQLLLDQPLGEHTGDMAAISTFLHHHINLGKCTLFVHLPYCTLPFLTIPIRSKYGSWACSDSPHVFFYVHKSHKHDTTHPTFLRVECTFERL